MASAGERQVRSERVGKYLLYHTIGKGTFGKCVPARPWQGVLADALRERGEQQGVAASFWSSDVCAVGFWSLPTGLGVPVDIFGYLLALLALVLEPLR